MTDEELAKGWVIGNTGFNPKEPLGKIATQTFLAGLEAGKDMAEADLATIAYMQGAERYKPKWHDLRKNPKDLPEENQEVLVYFTLPDKSKNDIMLAEFENNDFNFVDLEDVIAWCEVPIFKE